MANENWVKAWQREDGYGPAAGRIECGECKRAKSYQEAGGTRLRCSLHKNCCVKKDHSCREATADPALPVTDGPFCGKGCQYQTVTDGIRCTLYGGGEVALVFDEVEGKLLRCQGCQDEAE